MNTSKLLLNIRTSSGYTQPELAQLLGISPFHVARVEAGTETFTYSQLERFAKLSGISPTLLLVAVSEEPPELSGKELEKFRRIQKNLHKLLPHEAALPKPQQ